MTNQKLLVLYSSDKCFIYVQDENKLTMYTIANVLQSVSIVMMGSPFGMSMKIMVYWIWVGI